MSGIDYKAVDALMSQSQVFASAWALVGSRLDQGGELANAEQQKAELRSMFATALQNAATPKGMSDEATIRNLIAWVDSRITAEVAGRPDVNIWKPILSRTWSQMRRHLVEQLRVATDLATFVPWRCFHCDETFTDTESAREHFGTSLAQRPGCQIDLAEYRAMEEVNRRHCEEDTDLHRQIHGLQSAHQVALAREEEKGYARGLKDGKAMAVETVASNLGCPTCANFGRHYCPHHAE